VRCTDSAYLRPDQIPPYRRTPTNHPEFRTPRRHEFRTSLALLPARVGTMLGQPGFQDREGITPEPQARTVQTEFAIQSTESSKPHRVGLKSLCIAKWRRGSANAVCCDAVLAVGKRLGKRFCGCHSKFADMRGFFGSAACPPTFAVITACLSLRLTPCSIGQARRLVAPVGYWHRTHQAWPPATKRPPGAQASDSEERSHQAGRFKLPSATSPVR